MVNLPARSLSEHDEVRMVVLVPLDELDTGEVFPMSHGLLEQSLVGAAEIPVYLVGNDAVVPDSLLPCRGRPGHPTTERTLLFVDFRQIWGVTSFSLHVEIDEKIVDGLDGTGYTCKFGSFILSGKS